MNRNLPYCADCRHWIPSRLLEYAGKGVCLHAASGPRPRREQVSRALYVPLNSWCPDHEPHEPKKVRTGGPLS